MAKRQLILNGYKTAESGLWTLASCKITKASQVQTFVDVPGRYAPLDFSTVLTDGEPYYGSAGLEAVLESSEGNREERQTRIDNLVNLLDGYQAKIIHPDHPEQYMMGRVQVVPEYNDLAHCAVRVTAVCEPWFYNLTETQTQVELTTAVQTILLLNSGRLGVTPQVDVAAEATIVYGENTVTLATGTYTLPWLHIAPAGGPSSPNAIAIDVSGSGSLVFTRREAVLAE